MIKNIIMLGAPGVGKGTLAQILSTKLGFKHISTGDIFRNEISNKTKLGLEIKNILDSGKYVDDEITNALVKKNLSQEDVLKHGFILDGYPRTTNQANFLINNHFKIDKVILLKLDNSIILQRLLKRGREDDKMEIINKRLEIYDHLTAPLIDFYKKNNILYELNAIGTPEEIFNQIKKDLF